MDDLATTYPGTPAAVLLDRVRGYLGHVTRLLDAKTTLAEHRRLLVVGGWLSLLAATTLIDLHRDHAAAAHLRTAAQMARGHGPRRDRRLVPGDSSLAGTDRRGLSAGGGHFPGGTADRPEVGQRVHPGDRAGGPRLGQARRRPPDPAPARRPGPARPGPGADRSGQARRGRREVALEAVRSGRLAPVDGRRAREIVLAVAERGVPEAAELAEAYRETCDEPGRPALA